MKVYVKNIAFRYRHWIAKTLRFAARFLSLPQEVELSVDFVSEEAIAETNRQFRSVDKPTDVLSFPTLELAVGQPISLEEHPNDINYETGRLVLGEILICGAIAAQQAEAYGHSLKREISFLALHGFLHLCGFDHETDEDRALMEATQERILSALHIGR